MAEIRIKLVRKSFQHIVHRSKFNNLYNQNFYCLIDRMDKKEIIGISLLLGSFAVATSLSRIYRERKEWIENNIAYCVAEEDRPRFNSLPDENFKQDLWFFKTIQVPDPQIRLLAPMDFKYITCFELYKKYPQQTRKYRQSLENL